jgi:type I restriction enzyme M protein
VEAKDNREKVDISILNAEIFKTVEKINALRADIDKIIREIEA